jgi:hypothetical protein
MTGCQSLIVDQPSFGWHSQNRDQTFEVKQESNYCSSLFYFCNWRYFLFANAGTVFHLPVSFYARDRKNCAFHKAER